MRMERVRIPTLTLSEIDRTLVFDFFWKFSKLERSLKEGEFLRAGRDQAAGVDWRRFGNQISGRFPQVPIPGFQEAVEVLKRLSPKRQIVNNNQLLDWETIERGSHEADEEFVLKLLRTVRNNLFHGGKYQAGLMEELARDQEIMKAASCVLDGILSLLSSPE